MEDDSDDLYGDDASFGVTVISRKRNIREARISANKRPGKLKILKKSQTSAACTQGDAIDIIDVEEYLRKTEFLSHKWVIHQRRAEGDILYALFFFPRSISEVVDENSGNTVKVELISKICDDCIEYFEMRYGESLTKDYLISNIFAHLRKTTNTRIRLWSILYLITLEPALTRFLAETCGPTGFKKPNDYNRVTRRMKDFVYTLTQGTMVEESNINSVVNDTIAVALNAYLTPTNKPTTSHSLSSIRRK